MHNDKSIEVVKRYFDALYYLIDIGKVDNFNAYCTEMNVSRVNLYRIKREPGRKFDLFLLSDVVRRGISAQWLLTGQGNIMNTESIKGNLKLSDSPHQ